MNRKTMLITGCDGFLGKHLTKYFSEKGFNIVGVGRISSKSHDSYTLFNITLPDELFGEILKEHKPHIVIHCAGSSSVSNSLSTPYIDFKRSADLTGFVLDSIRKFSPNSKLIYFSSAAVYGNPNTLPISESDVTAPISPYGYHKLMTEILIKEYSHLYGINSVIFRVFSAFGEGLKKQVIFDLCKKLTSDSPNALVYGTGKESRDFIHFLDICHAADLAIKKDCKGTFNLASGNEVTISKLVNTLKIYLNSPSKIIFTGEVREGDPANWQADISKLKKIGFEPAIMFEQGIKEYCNWYISEVLKNE